MKFWSLRLSSIRNTSVMLLVTFFATSVYAQPGPPGGNPDCYKRTELPCPEPDFAPCNETSDLAEIESFEFAGFAGVNSSYYCPKLKYVDCPTNLKESVVVDDSVRYTRLGPSVQEGAIYELQGTGPAKICYENTPCALRPEISTTPLPDQGDNCFPCWFGPDGGMTLADMENPEYYPVTGGNAPAKVCPFVHWCKGVQDPPPTVVSPVYHASYDLLEENDDCIALYGIEDEPEETGGES